ncbi:type II/IV secretion system ATPase subunit [Natronomonas sp.]|uniref:type II/IV secretion system ATPase subunit n=1 Tax=Natronomonas sp. TaxID=2184060 RepID=UPI002FC34EE7
MELSDVASDEEETAAASVEVVLDDVTSYFADTPGLFAAPEDSFIEESWFDLSGIDPEHEVEWKWVNEPFAFVSLLYDPDEREYRYRVVEPHLDTFEGYVREDITTVLRNSLLEVDLEEGDDRTEVFRERAGELMNEHGATVDDGTLQKVLYYLERDFVQSGPIDPIMRDRSVEDISCDGSDVPVYVYHHEFRDLRTNVSFERRRLNSFVVRMAQRAGKQISVSDPLVDASLPDGSRVQLTFGGDIATRGSNFTIRKFADIPYTPIDLINWNTFSIEQMAYFWLAIENNKSLVFAGGTGSGKTTSMNAVSFFIPPASKIVSIEDTREVDLPHENWIQSVTRSSASGEGRGEVSMYDLLQTALRQRPEYLLVGEIRTEQKVALTFFQAMGTGHTAYTTIHADSVETALSRLQNPPLSIPTQMLQDLDVLNIQRQIYFGDRRVRRNQAVAELGVAPDDADAIDSSDVFRWNPKTDDHERVGDSMVLAQIAHDRGWGDEELAAELAAREELLEFLYDEEIFEYDAVAAAVQLFQKDQAYVTDLLDDGEFDPYQLVATAERPHDDVAGEAPPRGQVDEETWQQVLDASEDDPSVDAKDDSSVKVEASADGVDADGVDADGAEADGGDADGADADGVETDGTGR